MAYCSHEPLKTALSGQALASDYSRRIAPNKQTSDSILKLLTDKGAPGQCYIISENSTLDQADLPLAFALEKIVGSGQGSIVSCIPGQLAYYEGEEANERYLLEVLKTKSSPHSR